jgi:hypothetical protein
MKLIAQGTVFGLKVKEHTNRETGEVTKKTYVGLASQKTGGYLGENEITDIRITDDQMQANLHGIFNQLKGVEVQVPVRAVEWSMGKKSGIAFQVQDGARPVEVKQEAPLKTVAPAAAKA